jgi:probable rRNA maturation factor
MSTPRLRTAVRVDHERWQSDIPEVSRQCRKAVRSAWAVGRKALDGAHPFSGKLQGPVEVSVLLSSDAVVRGLNRDHRGKNNATNVLSFPGETDTAVPGAEILMGDIILAWETVESEAKKTGKSVTNHMMHLVVHGVLHLLGYDHDSENDATTMERLEVNSLARLGLPDPYDTGC